MEVWSHENNMGCSVFNLKIRVKSSMKAHSHWNTYARHVRISKITPSSETAPPSGDLEALSDFHIIWDIVAPGCCLNLGESFMVGLDDFKWCLICFSWWLNMLNNFIHFWMPIFHLLKIAFTICSCIFSWLFGVLFVSCFL